MKKEFFEKVDLVEDIFSGKAGVEQATRERDLFLGDFNRLTTDAGTGYIQTIKALPPDVRAAGVQWLDGVVNTLCRKVAGEFLSLPLFGE